MNDVSSANFGLLIAYLVPGLTALWGAGYFSPAIRSWLAATPADAPTVGGFLYITIASIAAGLIVSTVRWAVVDLLHALTGIQQPSWDFSRLQDNVAAYDKLVEIHYRYYQWSANMSVALAFLYVARRVALGFWTLPLGWFDIGVVLLEIIFLAGSRDTLHKYFSRTTQLLNSAGPQRGENKRKNSED